MEKLKHTLVGCGMTIKEALKRMDEAGEKTLFVTDEENKLLGSVTDGDIRRWILKGATLEKGVTCVMNKNPHYLQNGYAKEEAKDLMLSKAIGCLPIVDAHKRVISAIWWLDFFEKKINKQKSIDASVVIMAGGEGKRLSPFTNILPKSLIPIGDKPVIEVIMERFAEYGCKDFYLSVNYKANILKAYFDDCCHEYNISYIEEKKPLGTAGSLFLLGGSIGESFFVTNCDTLIDADYSDILEFHKANKDDITLVVSMKHYVIPYGICDINEGGALKAIKEKPEYDLLVNTGMYVLKQGILELLPKNEYFNITDLINKAIDAKKKVSVYPVSEKSWLDIGECQELQKTLKKFGVTY